MGTVWMLGTAAAGKGGIASVVSQYRDAGLIDGKSVRYVVTHHDRNASGKVLPFLLAMLRLWTALAAGQVRLVHAHTSYAGSFWRKLLLTLPALAVGTRVMIHLHGSKFMEFFDQGGRVRRSAIRFLFRNAWRVIALSEEWKAWVLRVEPQARVVILGNSLDESTGTEGGNDLVKEPTVLFLGRIGERKGTFDLVRAFALARARLGAGRLVVGGDGDSDQLLTLARELCVEDSVTYAGWVHGDLKRKLLSDCWLFALPSYQEGLPMAILEAMAYSRAVLSCPVGGIPQAVEDWKSGRLVPPGDIESLAIALQSLLGDRDSAKRMGAMGRQAFVSRFTHQVSFPKLLDLYREAGVEVALPPVGAGSKGP